jgi:hypothetical protein
MANSITAGNSSNGGTAITTDTSGTLNIVTGSGSGATAITVDGSQNVGVGTSTPVSPLTLGNNKVLGWPNAAGNFNGTTLGAQIFKFSDNNLYIDNLDASTNIIFRRNGAAESMRIDSNGNVLVTNPSGLGYGTGAGGTVTQATSKTTAVTINKPVGQIITSNSALGATAETGFLVNNSTVAATDIIFATNQNGNYIATAYGVAAGQFAMRLKNISAGSLSDAVTINFVVIKGVTA